MTTDPSMPRPKRVAPPKVKPVTVGKLRIEAIHWGRSRGFGQNGGYIAATDTVTGQELWVLKIYDIAYDDTLEEDVQDIFIEKIRADDGRLDIVDERRRHYLVDVESRTVNRR
jgi:hypothetical protein